MMKAVESPLLQVQNLHIRAPGGHGFFLSRKPTALIIRDVSFTAHQGQTLGIVGESGSGKSTLARTLCGLQKYESGEIRLNGQPRPLIGNMSKLQLQQVQMVFQDPGSSLNPRLTLAGILREPLSNFHDLSATDTRNRTMELLLMVGLHAHDINRYPHEFSGGQRQRIGIARALAAEPELLICDEPVSALDVSIQAQVLNLLRDLQNKLGLSLLFISHDLRVIRHISDQVLVLQSGRVVETGDVDQLINHPLQAYTKALLDAIPDLPPHAF